ncbi:MAG: hypothetical protein RLZZ596_1559 [Pseudomonadota bacterium]
MHWNHCCSSDPYPKISHKVAGVIGALHHHRSRLAYSRFLELLSETICLGQKISVADGYPLTMDRQSAGVLLAGFNQIPG